MNIIYIGTDTWRTDHLGCYGSSRAKTPNIDKLAAEGVVFRNVYADGLPTIPHRRVVYTGKSILPKAEWCPLGADDVIVPQVMKKAGYRTALIADLYHMFAPGMNFHRGFDSWEWIRGQENDNYRSGPRKAINLRDHVMDHLITPMSTDAATQYLLNTLDRKTEDDYFAARVCNRAINWLEDNADEKPFLLWLEMFDPHEPWDAPRRFQDMYCKNLPKERMIYGYGFPNDRLTDEDKAHLPGLYAAEVTFVDECIGRLLGRIEELGLSDNTAIIFSSDHGTHLGEFGCIQKTASHLISKLARIPYIVRHPDTARYAGKTIDALVSAVDMAPTLLLLAGQPIPPEMEGTNAWRLADGEVDSIRSAVYTGMWGFGAVQTKGWRYMGQVGPEPFSIKRETAPLLFDLAADPEETRNVAQQHPEVVAELDAMLQARFQGTPQEQADIVKKSYAESTRQKDI